MLEDHRFILLRRDRSVNAGAVGAGAKERRVIRRYFMMNVDHDLAGLAGHVPAALQRWRLPRPSWRQASCRLEIVVLDIDQDQCECRSSRPHLLPWRS